MGRELQAITDSLAQKSAKGGALPRQVQPVRGKVVVRRKSSSAPLLLLLAAASLGAAYFYFKPPSRPPSPLPVIAEPAPKKVVQAEPEKLPVPTVAESTEPTAPVPPPEPEEIIEEGPAVVAPKADVPAFFGRARKIMQERTKKVVDGYRANLRINLNELESALTTQLRRPKMATDEERKAITATLAEWKTGGGVIPESSDETIDTIQGLSSLMTTSRKRQIGIQDTFNQALGPESARYILGLEVEIERLKAKDDPAAAELVMEEIENTKKSPEYFANLMLGKEMAPEE